MKDNFEIIRHQDLLYIKLENNFYTTIISIIRKSIKGVSDENQKKKVENLTVEGLIENPSELDSILNIGKEREVRKISKKLSEYSLTSLRFAEGIENE